MNVIVGIVIGAALLVVLNRQQISAVARLQTGPSSNVPPGPPRLNLPTSYGGGVQQSDALSQDVGAAEGVGGALAGLSHVPVAGAIVGIASAIVGPLLAAHRARIQGATTENSHDAEVTALYDQAVAAIVAYWNRTHDRAGTMAEIDQLNQYLFTTMKQRVGAPGTAWSDTWPGSCNKSCTAGCCLYWADFYVPGSAGYGLYGLRLAVQQGGRQTITIPKVYPGKYSNFTRPLYTVRLS